MCDIELASGASVVDAFQVVDSSSKSLQMHRLRSRRVACW